ncbi:MAG: penicillin-binding transpeptidase domain-containing protein [Candidatus Binatia bacterium]
MKKRILAAGVALGLGLLLIFGRLVQLTTVSGEQLADRASRQHTKKLTLPSRRGAIFDRNGEPLALSVPAESLYVRPHKLPANAEAWVSPVAAAIHSSLKEVQSSFRSAEPFVWLKRRASPQEAAQVRALGLAGIDSLETERRFYPQGSLAAPLLGFTDIDAQGIAGIEKTYDRYLREVPAEIVGERDALGRMILVQGGPTPSEMLNVHLTIDIGLQGIAEAELAQAVSKTRALGGVAVVLDARTAEVLALAQVPTFNPNAPGDVSPGIRRNRLISDCYEPGSTLKTLLIAAALEEKIVSPRERIFCEYGRYPVGRSIINDTHRHGWLSVPEVLQLSSNIGAAKIGERLGKETYEKYLRAFGLGRKTELELPGESAGILPPANKWGRIHLVTASFGQGIAVTPIQLATAYAALANGGVLMRPSIVKKIVNSEGKLVEARSPQPLWQVVRSETADLMIAMMEKVVENEGTGRRAQVEGFRVAGKTGTSQKPDPRGGYSARGRIASFIGIIPAEQPRLVILVALDEPKTSVYGGQVAAPVFQAIAQQSLRLLGIESPLSRPDLIPALLAPAPKARQITATLPPLPLEGVAITDASSREPNFVGMSLREAITAAQRNEWRIVTQGSGYVREQTAKSENGEPVYVLTLTPPGGGTR